VKKIDSQGKNIIFSNFDAELKKGQSNIKLTYREEIGQELTKLG